MEHETNPKAGNPTGFCEMPSRSNAKGHQSQEKREGEGEDREIEREKGLKGLARTDNNRPFVQSNLMRLALI